MAMIIRQEKVKITKREMDTIEAFATARCGEDQSLYKKRGSFKRSDIVVGAMAEVGSYKLLRQFGFKVNKPDFKIYDKKKKSYDADLTDGVRHFHVKGQSVESAKRYGSSWLMQRWDPLVKNKKRFHYMIMTNVDLDTREVTIFGVVSFNTLHDWQCFGECTVPSFRHSKVAIYLETIMSLSTNARWGIFYERDRKK
jgi:hypothetical protein